MEIKKCVKCEHEWVARTKSPAQCPRCKSYKWELQKGNENEKTKFVRDEV